MKSSTSEMTPFSALTAAMQKDNESHSIILPADWLQGRTAYGGLSAALCLEATHRSVEDLPPLRSAQFCFVGPATGQLSISPEVLRKGKSTVMVGSDLKGASGLAVRSTFCFGAGRASAHDHQSLPMPKVPDPEQCPSFYVWPNKPNFTNHFEGRLALGARPRTPAAKPEMTVWLRHHDQGDESSLVRLLALADALPAAAMVMSTEPAMISTMTWSIEILDAEPFTETGWWLVQAIADTSREGYSAQSTLIWSPDGKPVLVARQNVAIFG
jgi:acyl-CoA thioesterase